jgi:hypothetical protein
MPSVGAEVLPKFNAHGGRFGTFYVGRKHFLKSPLFSTYKRRLSPPHSNNTQEHKSITKQEQEHLHSISIGPS